MEKSASNSNGTDVFPIASDSPTSLHVEPGQRTRLGRCKIDTTTNELAHNLSTLEEAAIAVDC